jgi:uncharacterized integral membrane protein
LFSKAARTIKLIFVALFALAFITFAASNHALVTVSLFPLSYAIDLPLFLLVILCLIVGVLISIVVISSRFARLRHQYVSEKKRALTFETELKALKAKNTSISTLPELAVGDSAR